MEFRRLGRTGLKVSSICLGTMQFGWSADKATSFAIMDESIELGCNFFDTADIYSSWADGNPGGVSETIIGEWLRQTSLPRHQLVLATKVRGKMGDGPNDQGLSRQHIMQAVEDSLRRLQTDYIDLYQVHAPDPETPLDETLQALDDLVRSGKVRYIGCSNYPAWLLMKSCWLSDVQGLARFDSVQPHYNYMHRAEFERGLQQVAETEGIGVIPYSPLAAGFLTGKYRQNQPLPESARAERIRGRYMNDVGFAAVEKLAELGERRDASVAQMAIGWVLANPAVSSAIIGANTIQQLRDTFGGAEVSISGDEKMMLDEITAWA